MMVGLPPDEPPDLSRLQAVDGGQDHDEKQLRLEPAEGDLTGLLDRAD
jgi:hypothetical protein